MGTPSLQPQTLQLVNSTFWYSNQEQSYADLVVSAAEEARDAGTARRYAYGADTNPGGGTQANSSQVRSLASSYFLYTLEDFLGRNHSEGL